MLINITKPQSEQEFDLGTDVIFEGTSDSLGYAADVIPLNGDIRAFAKWVVDNRQFDQVILEFGTDAKPSWIHVSCDSRNRREILRATNQR